MYRSCLCLAYHSLAVVIYVLVVDRHEKLLMEDPWDQNWHLSLPEVARVKIFDVVEQWRR
jgi:hypothetical protein